MQFQQDRTWDWKIKAVENAKIYNFHRRSLTWGLRRIDVFISLQLHKPFTVGELSIRPTKICNFSKIGREIEK